jgi:hypothetical protein
MTRFSKFSLAALGGATVFTLASPADALTVSRFRASIDEVRSYCERIDESFWKKRKLYGCGDQLGCNDGNCKMIKEEPPPRRRPPLTTVQRRDLGGKGNGGDNGAGGSSDSGGGGGGQGTGAAGRN